MSSLPRPAESAAAARAPPARAPLVRGGHARPLRRVSQPASLRCDRLTAKAAAAAASGRPGRVHPASGGSREVGPPPRRAGFAWPGWRHITLRRLRGSRIARSAAPRASAGAHPAGAARRAVRAKVPGDRWCGIESSVEPSARAEPGRNHAIRSVVQASPVGAGSRCCRRARAQAGDANLELSRRPARPPVTCSLGLAGRHLRTGCVAWPACCSPPADQSTRSGHESRARREPAAEWRSSARIWPSLRFCASSISRTAGEAVIVEPELAQRHAPVEEVQLLERQPGCGTQRRRCR